MELWNQHLYFLKKCCNYQIIKLTLSQNDSFSHHRIFCLSWESKELLSSLSRGQFHQHFMCSFYACRSQKRKNSSSFLRFWDLRAQKLHLMKLTPGWARDFITEFNFFPTKSGKSSKNIREWGCCCRRESFFKVLSLSLTRTRKRTYTHTHTLIHTHYLSHLLCRIFLCSSFSRRSCGPMINHGLKVVQ